LFTKKIQTKFEVYTALVTYRICCIDYHNLPRNTIIFTHCGQPVGLLPYMTSVTDNSSIPHYRYGIQIYTERVFAKHRQVQFSSIPICILMSRLLQPRLSRAHYVK